MNSAQMLYKLPQGTERLVWEDAFKRQVLTHRVQNLFTSWGYSPVQTPVFDFYDLYAKFLGKNAENVYRLVDREGDLLMLRSDITLFLARAMGVSLREGHAPLRVCYSDVILRHQDLEDISANEFFQIGAEFIGSKSPEGDLEILLLVEAILQLLGLNGAKIHMGSRAVFEAAFAGLSSEERANVAAAITLRRWDRVRQLAGGDSSVDALVALFAYTGTSSGAREVVGRVRSELADRPAILEAANDLVEHARTLESLGFVDRFRVDFSEVGKQDYYTGLVFQVYQEGLGEALAAGGRYDRLLKHFGLDSPSVGFSLHLRKVEHLVDLGEHERPFHAEQAQGKTFSDRWKSAQEARKKGRNVTL